MNLRRGATAIECTVTEFEKASEIQAVGVEEKA
jgi:hypothetical protein